MNGTERDSTDDIQLVRQGYARFFDGDGDVTDDINDADIVSVRREQEITTFIGKNSEQNKIKISLSQEQIVKRVNGTGPNGVKRSQSVNIQKTLFAPAQNGSSKLFRGQSFDTHNQPLPLVLRRPSLIPVKINDHSSSSRMYSSLMLPDRRTIRRPVEMYKSELLPTAVGRETARKFSMPNSKLHPNNDNKGHPMTSLPYIRTSAGPHSGTFDIVERKAVPLDDKFKCCICLNTFNDPRVLDCLHTFCLECLFDIEQPVAKANMAKVNVVSAPYSRENSEMDMSGSSRKYSHAQSIQIHFVCKLFRFGLFAAKNDGSLCTEVGTEFDGKSEQPNRKTRKSSIGTISSSHFKKIFSSGIKNKPDDHRRTRNDSASPCRNVRYSKDTTHAHVGHSTKRRLSTVTEKNKTVIKCPICAHRTEITIGGVTRVPKNFLLERQLQDELNRRENLNLADKLCSLCYEEIEVFGCSQVYELSKICIFCRLVGSGPLRYLSNQSVRDLQRSAFETTHNIAA